MFLVNELIDMATPLYHPVLESITTSYVNNLMCFVYISIDIYLFLVQYSGLGSTVIQKEFPSRDTINYYTYQKKKCNQFNCYFFRFVYWTKSAW